MSSLIATAAEAVKAALNAGAFASIVSAALPGVTFTAVRKYVPTLDFTDLQGLAVTVVAKSNGMEVNRRSGFARDIEVDVAVQKRISEDADAETEGANPEIDNLMLLVELITNLFKAGDRAGASEWLKTKNDLIYDVERLRAGEFLSVVSFTFKAL